MWLKLYQLHSTHSGSIIRVLATLMNIQLTWQRDAANVTLWLQSVRSRIAKLILCKLDVLVTFYHINHEKYGTGNCAKITSTYNRASWNWVLTLPLL